MVLNHIHGMHLRYDQSLFYEYPQLIRDDLL